MILLIIGKPGLKNVFFHLWSLISKHKVLKSYLLTCLHNVSFWISQTDTIAKLYWKCKKILCKYKKYSGIKIKTTSYSVRRGKRHFETAFVIGLLFFIKTHILKYAPVVCNEKMPLIFILNINMLVFLLKIWHDEVFTAEVNVVAGETINLEKPPLCAYGQ